MSTKRGIWRQAIAIAMIACLSGGVGAAVADDDLFEDEFPQCPIDPIPDEYPETITVHGSDGGSLVDVLGRLIAFFREVGVDY